MLTDYRPTVAGDESAMARHPNDDDDDDEEYDDDDDDPTRTTGV